MHRSPFRSGIEPALFPCLYSVATVALGGEAATDQRTWNWSIQTLPFTQSAVIRRSSLTTVSIFSTFVNPAMLKRGERGKERKRSRGK